VIEDTLNRTESSAFERLRRLARRAPTRPEERCDLCGAAIGPEHRHLLDLTSRQVQCACRACAVLLDSPTAGAGARRLIPTRILALTDFRMTDAQWESLQIPVNIAFLLHNSLEKRTVAYYPSPAGPTESLLPLAAWDELAQDNPMLRDMEPDVEALLIRDRTGGRDCYVTPIDECYRLVGLIRLHWKGLSGGDEVRREIDRFFADLNERATPAGGHDA